MIFRYSISLLVILWICFSHKTALSQKYNFINYGVKEGFPSSEVHCSMQDSKGYMWFGTDRGVVRYDGDEIEIFTVEDGLPDNVVFVLHEDHWGRIWFGTYSNKLAYFQDGRIVPYKYNDKISGKKLQYPREIYVDRKNTVYQVEIGNGMRIIDDEGNMRVEISKADPGFQGTLKSVRIEERLMLNTSFGLTDSSKELGTDFLIKHTYGDRQISLPLTDQKLVSSYNQEVKENTARTFTYFSCRSRLVVIDQINHSHTFIDFNNGIIELSLTSSGIWVCPRGEGAFYYSNNDYIHDSLHVLSGFTVTSVTNDRQNGYWFTTLEKGVFYAPNLYNQILRRPNDEPYTYVTALASNEFGEIAIGQKNGDITVLRKEAIQFRRDNSYEIYDIYDYRKNGRFDVLTDQRLSVYPDRMEGYFLGSLSPFASALLTDGTVVFCWRRLSSLPDKKLSRKDLRKWIMDPEKSFHIGEPCTCMDAKNSDQYLIGYMNGLKLFQRTGNTYQATDLAAKNDLYRKRINDVAFLSDGYVVASAYYGLIIQRGEKTIHFDSKNGLLSDQVSKIYVDESGNIWAATNNGLNRIDKHLNIYSLTTKQGLVSNEVTAVCRHKQQLYVGSREGLNEVDMAIFDQYVPKDSVHIKSISLPNGKKFKNFQNIEIPYDKNSLIIKVTSLNFRNNNQVQYRYRFKNLGEWVYQFGNVINLALLPSGDYTLQIETENENGEWSEHPTEVDISVIPPFWKTTWFMILVAGLTVLIISGIFYIRFSVKRRQAGLLAEINEYQQQALASQMNPHFIFNSLNSIQSFIAQNDRKLSNHYLARFAKLMRIILNNSRSPEITIAEEVYALELYLELESVRYKNFVFDIQIDPEINPRKALIPPLLLQPLVENAIWHGLMHKNESGNLMVKIALIDGKLECCVEDDGVGRSHATTKIGSSNHKSLSTSITNKRLELIGSQYSEKYGLVITDLYDHEDKPCGTKVCFNVPYKTQM